jgi:vacuolar protein sorting-associated protein 54
MPKKQHTLLTVLDQIKKEYADHNEKILNKFVSIIGGIVEHGLMKQIYGTDFDKRAKAAQTTVETPSTTIVVCCGFLDGVATNTRKMHQVLSSLLPPDHLKDVFSRIFAYIDGKVPSLFITAAETSENQKSTKLVRNDGKNAQQNQQPQPTFSFPKTVEGKRQLLLEVESTTTNLNNLEGIHPWDFTARNVLERRLEYSLTPNSAVSTDDETSVEKTEGLSNGAETNIQPDEVTAAESSDPYDDGEQSTASRSISRINSQDDDNEATADSSVTPSGDTDSPTPENDKVHSNEMMHDNVVATANSDSKEDNTTNGQSPEGNVVSDSSQPELNKGSAELSPDAPEDNVESKTVTPPEANSNPSVVESE